MSSYVFAPARTVSLPVHGVAQRFPVNRVFCVAQNYAQHAVEMGSSGREDPFFFMKPASSVVPVAAGTVQPVPYPSGVAVRTWIRPGPRNSSTAMRWVWT